MSVLDWSAKPANEPAAADDDALPLPPLNRRRRHRFGPGRRMVPDAVAIAELAIEDFRDAGLDLRLAGGELYVQEAGIWRIASKADFQYLRVLVQQNAEVFDHVTLGVLNAAWKSVNACPRLFSRDVPQTPGTSAVVPHRTSNILPIRCPVAQWASETLVQMDHGRIARSDLLVAFHQWCAAKGEVCPLTAEWFFPRARVACRPYLRTIIVNGTRFAGGIYWRQAGPLGEDSLAAGEARKI